MWSTRQLDLCLSICIFRGTSLLKYPLKVTVISKMIVKYVSTNLNEVIHKINKSKAKSEYRDAEGNQIKQQIVKQIVILNGLFHSIVFLLWEYLLMCFILVCDCQGFLKPVNPRQSLDSNHCNSNDSQRKSLSTSGKMVSYLKTKMSHVCNTIWSSKSSTNLLYVFLFFVNQTHKIPKPTCFSILWDFSTLSVDPRPKLVHSYWFMKT